MTRIIAPVLGELDRWLLAEGTHHRAWQKLGAHPMTHEGRDGTAFAVWAPNAERVAVVGDFNGWNPSANPLICFGEPGIWEGFVPEAHRGHRYKFAITGHEGRRVPLKADPFALRSEHAPGTASVIHGLTRHAWGDAKWMSERRSRQKHDKPISIYEVHLGSWRRNPDGSFLGYRQAGAQLAEYVTDLGFTHVELLPVSEHPLYSSWGYQPIGLFAPTCRYGEPEYFKDFIDTLHRANIGVFIDWVPAHFPADEHGLALFDGTHLYEHADPRKGRHPDWGTLVYNYGRVEVQNFLIANALYWLEEFHVDGLRVDAVASMLYLDYSRREGEWIPNRYGGRENLEATAFLRRFNEIVYAEHPDIVTIAEESTAWPSVSRPTSSGGLGFGFKWNMGWMHDTRKFLGCPIPARPEHHDEITFSMVYQGAENFVLPLSHDEVVHGKRSLLWSMAGTREEQFANLRLWLVWQWFHAGKKLLFMGGEFAQDKEWAHDAALEWHLLQHRPHRGMQSLVRDLNHLYRSVPALHEKDTEPGGFEWIDAQDRMGSVVASVRRGHDPSALTIAVANFSGILHSRYRVGAPLSGSYSERLNSDSALYGGQNLGNLGQLETEPVPHHGQKQSFTMTLPPLGAIVLVREPSRPIV